MPELPEVETTVRGLQTKVLNRAFVDVWSDWKKIIKKPNNFESFVKEIKDKKIIRARRRAKNVVMDLSDGYSLLIHMKMTGHLLLGKWTNKNEKWLPENRGYLDDPYNRFLHIIFFLNNGEMLALSDVRKFAKIELWKTVDLKKELEKLGPEPLDKDFNLNKFKKIFRNLSGGRQIKKVLMDPYIIAGIGNIYSSEALWWAKINPEKQVAKLSEKELKSLYSAIKKVLQKGVDLGGESFSDYRKLDGSKGDFDTERKAYKREGEPCSRCKQKIKRIKIGQRSAFYCPQCQSLSKPQNNK